MKLSSEKTKLTLLDIRSTAEKKRQELPRPQQKGSTLTHFSSVVGASSIYTIAALVKLLVDSPEQVYISLFL